MAKRPTQRQLEALDEYFQLVADYPDLFRQRGRRPLILDQATLLSYSVEHDLVLGVLAATPYMWLLNDLVCTTRSDGHAFTHPYLREIDPPGDAGGNGVVVLVTVASPGNDVSVVMVRQERHATGLVELELPRGFGGSGSDSPTQAARELLEETGYVAEDVRLLGSSLTDSGMSDGLVDYFAMSSSDRQNPRPEDGETDIDVVVVPIEKVWELISKGVIRDGYTLQALALLTAEQHSQTSGRGSGSIGTGGR